jgi:hypothetical protein
MTTPQPAGSDPDQSHDDPGRPPDQPDRDGPQAAQAQAQAAQPEPAGPQPAQPQAAQAQAAGRPPDWSTPATETTAPPLGGTPAPAPEPPTSGEPAPTAPDRPTGRDIRPWMILGAAALFLLCCYGGATIALVNWGGDAYRLLRDRTARPVGLNQPARDGDLEFRVRSVDCGVSRIGDPMVSQNAVGQFCVVQLDVRNVGRKPVTFADTLQRAYGPGGEQFVADPSAGILANADQQDFLTEINPGNQATGAVVYDIPRNSRIVRLRLHESAGSRGVLVRTG